MTEILGVEKPNLDVIVFFMIGGIEIPAQIPAEVATIGLQSGRFVEIVSYNNKRPIQVNLANVLFVDRLTEQEYLGNLEETRRQRMLQQAGTGRGIAIPTMTIPRKIN